MWPEEQSSLPYGVSVSLSGKWSQYHSLHWIDVRIRIMCQAHGQASVHIRFISEQTRSFAHPSRKIACPKMEHITYLVMTTWSSEDKEQFHQASHWCRDESLENSLGAGAYFEWTRTDSLSNGKITDSSSPFCLVCDPTHLSLFISGSVSACPAYRHAHSPSFHHSCQGASFPLRAQGLKELSAKLLYWLNQGDFQGISKSPDWK